MEPRCCCFLVLLLLVAFASATAFSQAAKDRMLARHNSARTDMVPQPAAPLTPAFWSATAEARALNWVQQCGYGHSGPGENLAAGAGHSLTDQIGMVDRACSGWEDEEVWYTLTASGQQSCSAPAGQSCGHYTQMVWDSSPGIGCAFQVCNTGSPFGGFPTWTYVVCNYEGSGNYIGQIPYEPCTTGNCGGAAASASPTRTPAASASNSRSRSPSRTPSSQASPSRTPSRSSTRSPTPTPAGQSSSTSTRTASRTPSRSMVCTDPCVTNECGFLQNNCGQSINCGTCGNNAVCNFQNGANVCVSNPVCNPADECQRLNFGCGNAVVCGINYNCGGCAVGDICVNRQCEENPCSQCGPNTECNNGQCSCLNGFVLEGGQCVAPTSGGVPSYLNDFTQLAPNAAGWTIPDFELFVTNSGSHLLRWDRSTDVVDKYTTKHNLVAKSNNGQFALAYRLGQSGSGRAQDRVEFRWSNINGNTATLQWCLVFYGNSYCASYGTRSFPSANGVPIVSTMGFDDNTNNLIVAVKIGTSTYTGYTATPYPSLGSIGYQFNSNSQPSLRSLRLATSSVLTVSLFDCIDETEWASMFYDLTGANPATTSVTIRQQGRDGNCAKSGKALRELVSGFTFVVTSSSVPAQAIASTFVSSVGTPAGAGLASAGVIGGSQGASAAGFAATIANLPGTVATASGAAAAGGGGGGGAAGLSGGAIAGIVIGSVAGAVLLVGITALVVAAVVVAAVVIAKGGDDDSGAQAQGGQRRSVRQTIRGFFGGVDVMNDPKGHQSITGRAPAMN